MSRTVLVAHTLTVVTGDPGTSGLVFDPLLSRVRITVTGLVEFARYRLERSTDQARWSTVRGGVSLAPTAGVVAVDDYEFTPDVPNFYRLVGPAAYDGFDRTVAAGGWGTASSGDVWSGTATQLSVDGAVGVVTHDAAGQSVSPVFDISPIAATAVEMTMRVPVVTTGATIDTGLILRRVDGGNYYLFNLIWQTDGTLRLDLLRQLSSVFTTLDSTTLSLTYTGAEAVRLRPEAIGATLRAKAWYAGSAPPSTWAVQATDGSHGVGAVAVRSRRNTGNTNGTTATTWDDLVLFPPETTVFADSITPTLDAVWLKSLARPFLNRPVTVVDYSDVERSSRSGIFPIVGRSLPVAVTDLHGSRRWTLDVLAETAAEAEDLDLLFSTGEVQFVHVPAAERVPGGYVALGDTTERRTARRSSRRVFSMPLTEVAAPGPDVVPAVGSWQTVLNTYATWADVMAAHPTWADLLQLVGSPADVVVP